MTFNLTCPVCGDVLTHEESGTALNGTIDLMDFAVASIPLEDEVILAHMNDHLPGDWARARRKGNSPRRDG